MTISHDRLSIIDLNVHANQPLYYKNYVLSFNGEIYNYKELKSDLINYGYKFKTNSDSEIILALFDKFKENSFKKLKGIFAISIWDKKNKELFLIRDLLGVKPLYYYIDEKLNIWFSSSIRSILLSNKNYQINDEAFNYYKNFGRNDLRETIFKKIFKLRPGELLIKKGTKIEKKKF